MRFHPVVEAWFSRRFPHGPTDAQARGWDAIGATWYGYTTLWINRAGLPLDPLGIEPTRTGTSLRAVLDFFPS